LSPVRPVQIGIIKRSFLNATADVFVLAEPSCKQLDSHKIGP